jgi:hypothetical protein
MKNAVFWDVVPCRSCVNRRLGGTYRLHLQTISHLFTLVPRLQIFLPWRWWRYVPPKRRFTQDLHGATSQKMAFFNLFPLCYITYIYSWMNTNYFLAFISLPFTGAARSKTWTVFAQWNTVAWFQSHSRHECLCAFMLCCVVLCVGSGLATGWSPSKESYCLCIRLRNWKAASHGEKFILYERVCWFLGSWLCYYLIPVYSRTNFIRVSQFKFGDNVLIFLWCFPLCLGLDLRRSYCTATSLQPTNKSAGKYVKLKGKRSNFWFRLGGL